MSKKFITRDLLNKYQENCDRIKAIADVCEKENRERNDEENQEYKVLCRENQHLEMRMNSLAADYAKENPNPAQNADKVIRENMVAGRQTQILLTRDLIVVADGNEGGIVPVKIQDIVEPLVEGLILDKVGLPMMTGLAGDYIWPVYEAVEATIQGEGVALTDTKINLSKLTASPQRVGIAIPVTRQAINQTEGVLEMIVKKVMPLAVQKLLNKVMFSTTKVTNATSLVGPFVGLASKATSLSAEPTFKEFNTLKANVLKKGVDGEHLCWVMTKAQKAIAEATPKDAGSGIMVCENDKIAGIPVYTTEAIGEGYIGLGDWRYQPMGLFGDISFIVDPYSQARKDAVDFVLNVNYGTTTLRPDAFALGKCAAS
ncbi:phage major capsid protein [uncultured Bacteroides sp.]|uniref:phage major capsid protein n=1 Tax=uncultured Bacteroides sp. TaxID=162156 RepID=UPI00261B72E4|nr:phage major capsid protein [uncultured Bacteroides sp.]